MLGGAHIWLGLGLLPFDLAEEARIIVCTATTMAEEGGARTMVVLPDDVVVSESDYESSSSDEDARIESEAASVARGEGAGDRDGGADDRNLVLVAREARGDVNDVEVAIGDSAPLREAAESARTAADIFVEELDDGTGGAGPVRGALGAGAGVGAGVKGDGARDAADLSGRAGSRGGEGQSGGARVSFSGREGRVASIAENEVLESISGTAEDDGDVVALVEGDSDEVALGRSLSGVTSNVTGSFLGLAAAKKIARKLSGRSERRRQSIFELQPTVDSIVKARLTEVGTEQLVNTLSSYVPLPIIEDLNRRHKSGVGVTADGHFQVPSRHKMFSTVLFADVSGFTAMSEQLARKCGRRGAEELARVLTSYLDRMTKYIGKSGGEVVKFVGDALLVVFYQHTDTNNPLGREDSMKESVRKMQNLMGPVAGKSLVLSATQCGLDLQAECHDRELAEGCRLSVKIGIGFGECRIIHIGDRTRMEYVLTGKPLHQAFHCESLATPGQVLLSSEALECIDDCVEVDMIQNCGVVKKLQKRQRHHSLASLRKNVSSSTQAGVLAELALYVQCFSMIVHDDPKTDKWVGRLQPLSVIFIGMGLEGEQLVEAGTDRGMRRFNDALCAVLRGLRSCGASLHKLMVDDKGSTLIATVGIPKVLDSDPLRAVRAGLSAAENLSQLDPPLYASVGITSTVCFVGKIGNTTRREIAILGDRVNLSARLMAAAAKQPVWPGQLRVLCDKATMQAVISRSGQASDDGTGRHLDGVRVRHTDLCFQSCGEISVKGKDEPILVYKPQRVTELGGGGLSVRPLVLGIFPDGYGSGMTSSLPAGVQGAAFDALFHDLMATFEGHARLGETEESIKDLATRRVGDSYILSSNTNDTSNNVANNQGGGGGRSRLQTHKSSPRSPTSATAAESVTNAKKGMSRVRSFRLAFRQRPRTKSAAAPPAVAPTSVPAPVHPTSASSSRASRVVVIKGAQGAGKTSMLRSIRVPGAFCRSFFLRSDVARLGHPYALLRALCAQLFGCPVQTVSGDDSSGSGLRPPGNGHPWAESKGSGSFNEEADTDTDQGVQGGLSKVLNKARWKRQAISSTKCIARYMETCDGWLPEAHNLNGILGTCFEPPEDLVEEDTNDLSLWGYPCSMGVEWATLGSERQFRHRKLLALVAKLIEAVCSQMSLCIAVDDADMLHSSTDLSLINLLRRRDAPGMVFVLTITNEHNKVVENILRRPRSKLIHIRGITSMELDSRIIAPEFGCRPGCASPRVLAFVQLMTGGNPTLSKLLVRDLKKHGLMRFVPVDDGSTDEGEGAHEAKDAHTGGKRASVKKAARAAKTVMTSKARRMSTMIKSLSSSHVSTVEEKKVDGPGFADLAYELSHGRTLSRGKSMDLPPTLTPSPKTSVKTGAMGGGTPGVSIHATLDRSENAEAGHGHGVTKAGQGVGVNRNHRALTHSVSLPAVHEQAKTNALPANGWGSSFEERASLLSHQGTVEMVRDFDFISGQHGQQSVLAQKRRASQTLTAMALKGLADPKLANKTAMGGRPVDLLTIPIELLVSAGFGALSTAQRIVLLCVVVFQLTDPTSGCPRRVLRELVPGGEDHVDHDIAACVKEGLVHEVSPRRYAFCNGYTALAVCRQALGEFGVELHVEETVMAAWGVTSRVLYEEC